MLPFLLLGSIAALAFFSRRGSATVPQAANTRSVDLAAVVRTIVGGRPDEMRQLAASMPRRTFGDVFAAGLLEMTANAVLQNRLPTESFEGGRAWTWALNTINTSLDPAQPEHAALLKDMISAMSANGLIQSAASTLSSQLTRGGS